MCISTKGSANILMKADILQAKMYLNNFVTNLEANAQRDDQKIDRGEKIAVKDIKKATGTYISTLDKYL